MIGLVINLGIRGLIPGETNRMQVRILAVELSICIKEGNTKE